MRFVSLIAFFAVFSTPVWAEGAAFPPFEVATFAGQLFWLFIVFAALYFLMSQVALPRVATILEDRRVKIDGALQAASDAQKKARLEADALETALNKARSNAQQIAQESHLQTTKEADARRREVEAELTQKTRMAESSVQAKKELAMKHVNDIAIDIASELVEKLIGQTPDKKDVTKAVQQAV